MALDPELLALLRCPRTRQTLSPAPAELLHALGLADGLVREDGTVVYPIRDGIPILLPEAALQASAHPL